MKKKVLFIIPNLIGGGAIKTVSNLTKVMKEKYDITVIALNKTEESYGFDAKVIALENKHSKNPIKKISNYLNKIKFVKKYKKENQIDYSISFLTWADMINTLSKTGKEKIIVSIRNVESIEYKHMPIKKIETYLTCKLADKVVAISNQVRDDLIENFKVDEKKVITIYNPSVISKKENEKIEEQYFKDGKVVITLGNLKFQKGQWHLIRAFKNVVKENSRAKLLILGEGEYREYLERLIKELELENNVFLLGFVKNAQQYVEKADIFVFSSMFEGLGNALMEALNAEKPIISTDYDCGAREILAPETDYNKKTFDKIDYCNYGVLVPVFDGKKYEAKDVLTKEEILIGKAINELLSDEKLCEKYRENTKKRTKDFEIRNIVKYWYELLESV